MAGEFAAADAHFAEARRLHDPDRDQVFIDLVAQDQTVGLYCYWAIVVWCLGRPDHARQLMEQAVGWGRKTPHLLSRSYALSHACVLASMLRDIPWLTLLSDELKRITAEYGQRLYDALGQRAAFIGRTHVSETSPDEFLEAFAEVEKARKFAATSNAHIFSSFYDAAAAGALIARGETTKAATSLADAKRAIATTDEHLAMAEVHRISGLLHLAHGAQRDAEAAFEEALDVARQQGAHAWQLRAATSLAQLWAAHGKRQRAHDLLAPIYAWFTEGLDTADLKDARALLDQLA
jgi:predicted ATPase